MFKGRRNFADRALPKACSSCMAYVTSIRDKSPVESFYKDEHEVPLGGKAVTYRNDIYMVLNQRRLSAMTLSQFSEYLDHDRSDSQLQSIRDKMTDEQLFKFTKSRYIQSIGELRAWSDYLESEYASELGNLKSAINSAIEENNANNKPIQEVAENAPSE